MELQHAMSPAVHSDLDEALRRARADFREMPGLRLTCAQARRLWMIDATTCAKVLSSLVASGFLSRSGPDAFVARLRPSRRCRGEAEALRKISSIAELARARRHGFVTATSLAVHVAPL
jgi:hypothetical protein